MRGQLEGLPQLQGQGLATAMAVQKARKIAVFKAATARHVPCRLRAAQQS